MRTPPAQTTRSTKVNSLFSLPLHFPLTAKTVLPSYFAVKIHNFRKRLLSNLPEGDAAELRFALQFLLPPLVRRVV
jgi:hypothetical protein